jgi:hypothetical protein
MKRIIALLFIIQFSFIGYGQSLENIDYLNGFKQFKFGKKANELNDIEKDDLLKTGNRVSKYIYRKKIKLRIDFPISFIDFIDNELYSIKLFKNFSADEIKEQVELKKKLKLDTPFDSVAEELIELFGNEYKTYEIKSDLFSEGGNRTIWETKKNYVELCFREFGGKYRIEVIFVNKKLENKAKLSNYE